MTADLAQDVILWGGVAGAIVAIIALDSPITGKQNPRTKTESQFTTPQELSAEEDAENFRR